MGKAGAQSGHVVEPPQPRECPPPPVRRGLEGGGGPGRGRTAGAAERGALARGGSCPQNLVLK